VPNFDAAGLQQLQAGMLRRANPSEPKKQERNKRRSDVPVVYHSVFQGSITSCQWQPFARLSLFEYEIC